MDWKELARSLPFGASRKVECCGDGPSTYINNTPKGISIGPCFRCGERDFIPHGKISSAQLTLWRQADTAIRGMRVPAALSELGDWPAEVLVWLGAAGLSPEHAARYDIAYDPRSARVILPITTEGTAHGFVARAVSHGKDRPKYIASRDAGNHCWLRGRSSTLVVVEDILSAIRVYEAGFRAFAAMGTSFSQEALTPALVGCTRAVSWLDPDEAGRKAHGKLRKAFSLWDQPLYRVQSERDPKAHTKLEIQTYIKEALE